MKAKDKLRPLTIERLRQVLDYDPLTGVFTWRLRSSQKGGMISPGTIAGFSEKGYIRIKIDKINYYSHRLAWFYMTERWPIDELDHINLDKADNRFVNLREATRSENCMNVAARTSSKGVAYNRGGWQVQIMVNYKVVYRGRFKTRKEAVEAYEMASKKYHGAFGRIS